MKAFLKSENLSGKLTIVLLTVLFAAGLFLKAQTPQIVRSLYEGGNFDLLNQMAGSTGQQSLDFYLGETEENFFGPAFQVFLGGVFVCMALLMLPAANKWFFGGAIFVYLILTKWDVLFYPPYGDAIGGPFAEAIWLARHSFDYIGLYHHPGYAVGGAKVYMFSVFPSYLAFLLKLIPSTAVFLVVNHLAVFAMAAVIGALLRETALKVFSKYVSVLLPVLLISLPSFQAQTEAINMEMPCAFFIMLSAYFMAEKRIHWSGFMAVAAVLVKGTGIIACGAFVAMSVFLLFPDGKFVFQKKILAWDLALVVVSLASLLSKFLLNDQHVSVGMVALGKGWPSLNHMYIFYMYMISLAVYLGFCIYERFIRKNIVWTGQWTQHVMFVYGAMWFLLFLNFFAVSPRYRILAYPFVVFCVFQAFSLVVRRESFRRLAVVPAILTALFASYGHFYGGYLPGNYHVLLERSLEYRGDLKLNQRMANAIEKNFAAWKVGAPFIIAQLLALPELGYVTKDLNVLIYGFHCQYGGIENYPGLNNLDLGRTVYVAAQIELADGNQTYPIHPAYDKILKEIQYGNKKAWLFMGGAGIEQVFKFTQMLKARQQMRK